jgi:ATP-dependent Clp protease ATP-binding subunit ClpC
MSLDMGLLLAGAKERGELETRVSSLIEETQKAGNVILLIDEVHTLVGSGSVGRGGSSGAGLDIANLMKPALARGLLQVLFGVCCMTLA